MALSADQADALHPHPEEMLSDEVDPNDYESREGDMRPARLERAIFFGS